MTLIRLPVPKETSLTHFIRKIPDLNLDTGLWVAGGAARRVYLGEELGDGDIDIFVPRGSEIYANTIKSFEKEFGYLSRYINEHSTYIYKTSYRDFRTDHNTTVQVQIVNTFRYDTLQEVFDNFDFTVTKFATDGREVITVQEAIDDHNTMTLRADTSKDPRGNSRNRFLRYIGYGFNPLPGVMQWTLDLLNKDISKDAKVDFGAPY